MKDSRFILCTTKASVASIIAALYCGALFPVPVLAEEIESSVARGGRLYDNWISSLAAEAPKENHSAWPASNTSKSGAVTWRCKSCHGWDYKGRDGAYAAGSYKTGILGITRFVNAEPAKIVEIMRDKTHGLGERLKDQDLQDLALFVSKGQVDYDPMIDRASKAAKGNVAKGEVYYNTICAGCHAKDGTKPKDMPESLGKLMTDNPWETTHKVLNGQPAEPMPAMRAIDRQVVADIIAYLATLPKTTNK